MNDPFAEARRDVWEHARKMWQFGLSVAASGNVSRRVDAHLVAITPTSVSYDLLREDQIVVVEIESGNAVASTHAASYELPMHLSIYRSRADVGAIVHTHAPYATTLSVLRRPLPPFIDEMLLHFGGTVEVAEYAFTGTDQVGTNVVRALGERNAALLANHGNVCVGRTLVQALNTAATMEACARVYLQALAVGQPVPLPDSAIAAGRHLFEERR
jgi:L-fuculose-phosphate aldolase